MRRGQISLEMFFAFSLFILLLFWLNNFAESAGETGTVEAQLDFAAASLAAAAGRACALNISVNWTAPCTLDGNKPVPYSIGFNGTRAFNVTSAFASRVVSASVPCAFETDKIVPMACVENYSAGSHCIYLRSDGRVRFNTAVTGVCT